MIDHYYDKLLHIVETDVEVTGNEWLVKEARKMSTPLVKVCLEFGKNGEVPDELIKQFVKECSC